MLLQFLATKITWVFEFPSETEVSRTHLPRYINGRETTPSRGNRAALFFNEYKPALFKGLQFWKVSILFKVYFFESEFV